MDSEPLLEFTATIEAVGDLGDPHKVAIKLLWADDDGEWHDATIGVPPEVARVFGRRLDEDVRLTIHGSEASK